MAFVFGGGSNLGTSRRAVDPTKDCRRVIARGTRNLAGECLRLEREEKKCIALVRQAVKNGHHANAQSSATELVRIRLRVQDNKNMQGKFHGMATRLNTISTTQQMTQSMQQMTAAMTTLNAEIDVTSLARIVAEFERQDDVTSEKESLLHDTLTEISTVDQEDTLADDAIGRVLAELGLELPTPPSAIRVPAAHQLQEEEELQKRLDMLR